MSDSDVEKSPVSIKRARESSFEQADPKYQEEIIESCIKNNNNEEEYYLISQKWYNKWKQYCTRMSSTQENARTLGEQTNPGPINNSSLVDQNQALVDDLVLDDNVFAVSSEAWKKLVDWYGVQNEQHVIVRYKANNEIELYPPQFRLYLINSRTMTRQYPIKMTLSKSNTKQQLIQAIKDQFDLNIADDNLKLWLLAYSHLECNVPLKELKDAIVFDHDDLSLISKESGMINLGVEVKDNSEEEFKSDKVAITTASSTASTSSTNTTTTSTTNSSLNFTNGFSSLTTSSTPTFITQPTYTRGVCGLQNLGNTCFMNSALQCLSNTKQLTKYFLSNIHKKELNPTNPLGMKGQVAEAYGELIHKLWSSTSNSYAPRDFKYTIGRFNSSFSGYQQHDTQELLAFLLDGLHEDLNRIIKKPYIELPDFKDMHDNEIAAKSWDYHKVRNDSVIVDLFQGQFKSRLICNVCENMSVTFDPFMYLSLPLPIQKQIKTSIIYVPYDPAERIIKTTVTLGKEASISHLVKKVAQVMSVEDPSHLLVVEIFNHKIYKVFAQYEPVATIGSADIIYVYELPGPVPSVKKNKLVKVDSDQLLIFPVYCATVEKSDSLFSGEQINQFGDPIILAVPNKDANKPDLLYSLLSAHIERYTLFKLFQEVHSPQSAIESVTEDETEEVREVDRKFVEHQEPADESVVEDQQLVDEGVGEQDVVELKVDNDFTDQIINETMDETLNDSDNSDMEVDQKTKFVHTAAAVKAAGGKKTEPMSNLFTMKVFSSPASRSNYMHSNELLPSVQNWSGLVDLKERAEKEYQQLQDYELQEQTTQLEELKEEEEDTVMNDSEPELPSNMDEEDEEVEDAQALYNNIASPLENTMVPIVSMPVKERKRLVTKPPATIIRQGEGILLAWSTKKAIQLFGAARNHSESGVSTEAWEDMLEVKDPDDITIDNNAKKQVTLSDCLDEFTKEEELSEEDLWYCPKCKQHQRATKKFDLWRMPEILVVHLKRFSHSRTWRDKIDALIDFPTAELDLTGRVLSMASNADELKPEDRLVYDLYAVDNHYGGLGGGHYTSCAQNFEDKQWYNFDDSHVTKVNVDSVKTTAAYLLFYKRRRPVDEREPSIDDIIQEQEQLAVEAEAQARAERAEAEAEQKQKYTLGGAHTLFASEEVAEEEPPDYYNATADEPNTPYYDTAASDEPNAIVWNQTVEDQAWAHTDIDQPANDMPISEWCQEEEDKSSKEDDLY